jgi:hypothetical protein
MDGASKFVKGDAIAAIIITLINLIGGMAIGVMQLGMAPGDAVSTYSLLTVGDGLVSRSPRCCCPPRPASSSPARPPTGTWAATCSPSSAASSSRCGSPAAPPWRCA